MNQVIIDRWNNVVAPDDIVYHLGDVMMGADIDVILKILSQLNGKKYLAYGNHDTIARLEAFTQARVFEDIQMGYRIKLAKNKTGILTHYPTIVTNGDESRTFNFFGHTHQTTNFYEYIEPQYKYTMYHVGLDSHNCTPVPLEAARDEINRMREASKC